MKKHWLNFLHEAGRSVLRRAFEQENKLSEIQRLKQQIDFLEKEYKATEYALESWIKSEWTASEIKEAKLKAKQQ